MISKKIILTFSLLIGFASHAHVDRNDLFAGIATGLVARGISYALKKHGRTTHETTSAAGFVGVLATGAVQKYKQDGSVCGGIAQLTTALATYLTLLYVWPDTVKVDSHVAIWGPETFIEASRES